MQQDIERSAHVLRDDAIIEHLERLNAHVAKQNSLPRMFLVGVIYGIGFFLGSAIIATIVLGLVGPYFAQISWVHDSFESGASLLH
jgi:hypothetical protein